MTGASSATGCIFCDAGAEHPEHRALVIHRGRSCFVILNKFPYNNGHVMVVPFRHIASLTLATPDELADLMTMTAVVEAALADVYHPHGLNIGVNLGRAAGAGVEHHLHVHVVPRWNGDTNFMTAVGDVRVLPEALDASAERLRPVIRRLTENSAS